MYKKKRTKTKKTKEQLVMEHFASRTEVRRTRKKYRLALFFIPTKKEKKKKEKGISRVCGNGEIARPKRGNKI